MLRACHEGGQVLVEISDDGAGIDTARVKSKAIERGVITAQQAARMSEGELLNLVFLPGFSTAEKVTNLSGRGVGMDVVKTNIDRVNGTVDLQSYPGKGHDHQDQNSPDPGDRPGGDHSEQRKPVRHSPGQHSGIGSPGCGPRANGNRVRSRCSGVSHARAVAAPGVPQ